MAWTEFKATDASTLSKFVALQQTAGPFYASKFDTTYLTTLMGAREGVRTFNYDDGTNVMNLGTCVNKDTLVMMVMGLGKYKDFNTAVDIMCKQVQAVFKDSGVHKIMAVWSEDANADQRKFFEAVAKGGEKYGAKNIVFEVTGGTTKVTMDA